jgi:glycolate dehydrogenase iron-sulfur subunit
MDERIAKWLEVCSGCGKCREVCPVFDCTLKETDVARGRLQVIRELGGDSSRDLLSACLLCGACEDHCDAGVKVTEIVRQMRADQGVGTLKRLVFKNLLDSPTRLKIAGRSANALSGLLGRRVPGDSGLHLRLGLPQLVGQRRFPVPPKTDFLTENSIEIPGAKVALFSGCVFSYLAPQVATDALAVLDKLGIEVAVPADQACCGLVAFGAGDREVAKKLSESFVRTFDRYETVVALCASCAAMLKVHLPEVLPEASDLSARVVEISEFLLEKGVEVPSDTNDRIGYHAPCHLRFAMHSDAPFELCGPKAVPLDAQCCGFGGSFTLAQPEKSAAIGKKRAQSIESAEVDAVATSCSGCYLGLFDALKSAKKKPRVCHPVQLLGGK